MTPITFRVAWTPPVNMTGIFGFKVYYRPDINTPYAECVSVLPTDTEAQMTIDLPDNYDNDLNFIMKSVGVAGKLSNQSNTASIHIKLTIEPPTITNVEVIG